MVAGKETLHRIHSLTVCLVFVAGLTGAPSLAAQENAPVPGASASASKADQKAKTSVAVPRGTPVLWEDPGDIAQKNLFYGVGGPGKQPKAPFTYLREDSNGTNPKFDVRDGAGIRWRVKLGPEARPETVATRLVWAVGYFVPPEYVLPTVQVKGLTLKRGEELLHGDEATDARFKRQSSEMKKAGVWRWKTNPFTGTREFNGLRVLMAVINNWDLKDVNNAVYVDAKHNRSVYLISDLGATFASNDEHVHHGTDKGDLASYEKSRFITKRTATEVSFATPMLPGGLLLRQGPVLLGETIRRSALDWIGHDIPIADARWMGGLLGQLSHQQLEDAFRAGNFPPAQRDAFVQIVESRIAELKAL